MMPHGSPGSSLLDPHTPKQAVQKPDKADRDAIVILNRAADQVSLCSSPEWPYTKKHALKPLIHAIRHLARPDRDVYPKWRGASKGEPLVRR